jgi:hypothetical protein
MQEPQTEAASVTIPAPERLAAQMASSGFNAAIRLTRNGQPNPKDPEADPGPIDDPIGDQELQILRGLLAAYDKHGA